MLEDIENALKNNEKKEYFLGCMIWNSKETQEDDMQYRFNDILDGQQRFITLYILQAVLRDLSTDNELKNKANDRMKQKKDIYDGIPERNRIVFSIREDSEFVENYIIESGGTLSKELANIVSDKKQDLSVRNMANAILSMHIWWEDIRNKLNNTSSFQKYVSNYYTYLSSKVLVLYLSTSNNLDDAYNLFTVLNSRGVQLRSSDIIKAQNLRAISNDKTRRKYAKKWDEYNNFIEMPFNSFDEFLWTIVFIIMKYRSDANKSLSKAFNFIQERKHLKPGEETFDFIGQYAEHVESLAQEDFEFDKNGYLYANLNHIMSTTMGNSYMILLMFYYDKFRQINILDFIIKIDNLFSMSWLLENRNLETRTFIILRRIEEIASKYADIKEASSQLINDDVLKYEYEDPNTSSTKLDINTFFNLLENQQWGSFAGSRINKTRYLLL